MNQTCFPLQTQPTTAIADSFPGMESMQPVSAHPSAVPVQLKNPPKWLKRPVGASFGFGGKLVTFEAVTAPANQQQQQQAQRPQSVVQFKRVVTEPELVERSLRLETSIANANMPEFCDSKVAAAASADDQQVWRFIRASFEDGNRLEFLNLLGYSPDDVSKKIEDSCGVKVRPPTPESGEDDAVDDVAGRLNQLDTTADKENAFEAIASEAQQKHDLDREKEERRAKRGGPFGVRVGDDPVGHLSKALLVGNIELAVELCLEQKRTADALALAIQGGPELVQRTQRRYFASCASDESHLIETVVSGDWESFVSRVNAAANPTAALTAVVTYAPDDEFPGLCSMLGKAALGFSCPFLFI